MKRRAGVYNKLIETGYSRFEHNITIDISRTLPRHIMFHDRNGSGQKSLYNVLKAYAAYVRLSLGTEYWFWILRSNVSPNR